MPNGAQKAALSLQLFDKQGTSMIPLLNQGSAEIARLAEEARVLGLDMTPEAARVSGLSGQSHARMPVVDCRDLTPSCCQAAAGVMSGSRRGETVLATAGVGERRAPG
jgi:hypothetical protein